MTAQLYEEWSQLDLGVAQPCILDKYEEGIGTDIACKVIDPLIRTNGNTLLLDADKDHVDWVMESIYYGLSARNTSESSIVLLKNCVRIYIEWLTCLTHAPSVGVPKQLIQQPTKYGQKILVQLQRLFSLRSGGANTDAFIMSHGNVCHNLLKCIEKTCTRDLLPHLRDEMWPAVLTFLLVINDKVLTPPYQQNDQSQHLSSRVLSSLFELWLLACESGHFPAPKLWKTFHRLSFRWRHRTDLIDHWVRAVASLTCAFVNTSIRPDYCSIKIGTTERNVVSDVLKASPVLAQCWPRMLHLLGNPADIGTDKFYDNLLESTRNSSIMADYSHCVAQVPFIYFRAMRGVYLIVQFFLGEELDLVQGMRIPAPSNVFDRKPSSSPNLTANQVAQRGASGLSPQTPISAAPLIGGHQALSHTPSLFKNPKSSSSKDKDATSKSPYTPSISNLSEKQRSNRLIGSILAEFPMRIQLHPSNPLPKDRPTVALLVQLFGNWLFRATQKQHSLDDVHASAVSHPQEPDSVSQRSSEYDDIHEFDGYQAARADAFAALCLIFTSKRPDESISEELLAKFYAVLQVACAEADPVICCSILFYGQEIMRQNLAHNHLLVQGFTYAVYQILKTPSYKTHPGTTIPDLSRACLLKLSAILPFAELIKENTVEGFPGAADLVSPKNLVHQISQNTLLLLKDGNESNNLQISMYILCQVLMCAKLIGPNVKPEDVPEIRTFRDLIRHMIPELCRPSWLPNHSVLMAALDTFGVLTTLPDVFLLVGDSVTDILKGLCTFIHEKLGQEARYHSREMHSVVVAAYMTLARWLVRVPRALSDSQCMDFVTKVIQLGINGTTLKSDVAKPASQRVRDAAKYLLNTLAGVAVHDAANQEPPDLVEQSLKAKTHFIWRNSVMLTFVEEPSAVTGNSTVAVIRHPAGTAVWRFELMRSANQPQEIVPRPTGFNLPHVSPGELYTGDSPQCFPADVDRIPKVQADYNLPESWHLSETAEHIRSLLGEHRSQARWAEAKGQCIAENDTKYDLLPPKPVTDIRVPAMFLSGFGFLDSLLSVGGQPESLRICENNIELELDLKQLDSMPAKIVTTCHVFSVSADVTSTSAIINANKCLAELDPGFYSMIQEMGELTDVADVKSFVAPVLNNDSIIDKTNDDEFYLDGVEHVSVWFDSSNELQILMPTDRYAVRPKVDVLNKAANASPRDSFGMTTFDSIISSSLSSSELRSAFTAASMNDLVAGLVDDDGGDGSRERGQSLGIFDSDSTALFSQSAGVSQIKEMSGKIRDQDRKKPSKKHSLEHLPINIDGQSSVAVVPPSLKDQQNNVASHPQNTVKFRQHRDSTGPASPQTTRRHQKHTSSKFKFWKQDRKSAALGQSQSHARGSASLDCIENVDVQVPLRVPFLVSSGLDDAIDELHYAGGTSSDDNAPPVRPPRSKTITHDTVGANSDSSSSAAPPTFSLTSSSQKAPKPSANRSVSKLTQNQTQNFYLLVIWLEDMKDFYDIKIDELISHCWLGGDGMRSSENYSCIFISPVSELGISRIRVMSTSERLGRAGPLFDGSVVLNSFLVPLLRQTLLNLSRRWKLEQEGSQLPYIRRKQKIHELAKKFTVLKPSHELLQSLIVDP